MKSLVPETDRSHRGDLIPDLRSHPVTGARAAGGQSLVEFALVMPILALLLLGILDFSRVFTSMMTIESAAREAADYGAWRPAHWSSEAIAGTVAGMQARACVASENLPDFDGTATACTNPTVSIDLLDETNKSALGPGGAKFGCETPLREPAPCRVKVDLTYTFDLIVPLGFELAGVYYGLPPDVTFTRTSVFAISDFAIDR